MARQVLDDRPAGRTAEAIEGRQQRSALGGCVGEEARARAHDDRGSRAALSLALRGGLFTPLRARAALHALVGDVGPVQLELLELLISELVTNSVLHGCAGPADTVTVRITVSDDTVRGEVADPGPGFTPADPPRPRAVGGLGLVIVDRVSDRWGTSDDGRRVWFELNRAPAVGVAGQPIA